MSSCGKSDGNRADLWAHGSASQTERIELILVALRNKIGEGGMKHYGISGRNDDSPKPVLGSLDSPEENERVTNDDRDTMSSLNEDGVYL